MKTKYHIRENDKNKMRVLQDSISKMVLLLCIEFRIFRYIRIRGYVGMPREHIDKRVFVSFLIRPYIETILIKPNRLHFHCVERALASIFSGLIKNIEKGERITGWK